MSKYRLRDDEKMECGVKRIATALVRNNIADLSNAELDRSGAIHEARKRCKMIRGLLRLVRSSITFDFRALDRQVRDAAECLSYLRDRDVIAETIWQLRKGNDVSISAESFSAVQSILLNSAAQSELQTSGVHKNEQDQIAVFLTDMESLLVQIESWSFRAGLNKAVRSEFAKTYRQGLKLMKASSRMPSEANLHRWRKRVKYHEHQLQLLSSKWKGHATKRIARLVRLAKLLGDDHDLAMIHKRLSEYSKVHSNVQITGIGRLMKLLANRRCKLQSAAFHLGKELYFKCPDAIKKRIYL